jgi:hypothetical protein
MTDTDTRLEPLAVVPRHDVHPQAYRVTAENILALAAHLSLNVLATAHANLGTPIETIEIPFERRYNLVSAALVGDWIIRHPVTVRDLEVISDDRFAEQYDRADHDLLDMAVSEEFPDAHAWALIADTPDGVRILPGRSASGTLIVGMAQKIARGKS